MNFNYILCDYEDTGAQGVSWVVPAGVTYSTHHQLHSSKNN